MLLLEIDAWGWLAKLFVDAENCISSLFVLLCFDGIITPGFIQRSKRKWGAYEVEL